MFDKLYVEVNSDSIKYLVASKLRNRLKIKKAGKLPLGNGAFGGGTIMDRNIFMKSLQELKSEIKNSYSAVSLTVNDGSFITRAIDLPITNEKDIEKHLAIDAEQYLPIMSGDYEISFRIIGRLPGEGEAGSRVLVSAGPRDSIMAVLKSFGECGLHPSVFDVYPNNICRLFEAVNERNIAVIGMGKQSINITILKDGSFFMHSNISTGLKSVIDSYEESAAAGMENGGEKLYFERFDYDMINNDESAINGVLRYGLNEMLRQISKYLEFFSSRHFGKTVDRIYVTSDNAMLIGLKGIMESGFKTSISIGLDKLPVIVDSESTNYNDCPPCYYSLIGMALRGGRS